MAQVLKEICAKKALHIQARKKALPLAQLEAGIQKAPAVRGFQKALMKKQQNHEWGLIAEIKKASPSKGIIRADFDPAAIAAAYEKGGATCLSVLTDEPYFQGKDEYLAQAREAVSLPVLRKDFMLDTYQVAEARALGADCILLIMAALSNEQAMEMEQAAMHYGMDVLAEIHSENEMGRVYAHLKTRMMGINNRNLQTLEVDLRTAESLAPLISSDYVKICESGIAEPADLQRMRTAGMVCFLIGESLMRKKDIESATRTLMETE